MDYTTLPSSETVDETIQHLKEHGMDAFLVENGEQAKEKVLARIPEGAEVMNMTSVTLDTLGLSDAITQSGKYDAVKSTLMRMNRETQGDQMRKLGASPLYAVGSVHAVTKDGSIVIASNTGSQLSAYAYGAAHVILVIGTQKIVPNMDDAMKRVYEHSLPLESERARKAYGVQGSFISKLLVIHKEVTPGRISVIFIPEVLGF